MKKDKEKLKVDENSSSKVAQELSEKLNQDADYGDRIPHVGELVLFTPNHDDRVAKANNNDGPIPAIVTRVWSNVCVNLKIIPDCGPVQDRTSVVRIDANPAGYHFEYINL